MAEKVDGFLAVVCCPDYVAFVCELAFEYLLIHHIVFRYKDMDLCCLGAEACLSVSAVETKRKLVLELLFRWWRGRACLDEECECRTYVEFGGDA